jgi:tRNA modification GTPase
MIDPDTIVALSTPPGRGAIALVRCSGSRALAIVRALARELPVAPADRTAILAELRDREGVIDEGIVTFFPGPRSYTGEDVVEISVHGSPYVTQRLLEALIQQGARMAKPGEFTLRAYLNRKLDLSQAEAVADLIASENRAAHDLAMRQLRGGYSRRIEELRQKLIDFGALIELELDFSEEDVEFARRPELIALLDEITGICDHLIASFRYGNAVKQGVPVAIVGAPNSGKSTLLNALLQEDRAIVSDIPGTTRDTVEETITIEGVLFRFIDTAGLRESGDLIEKLGIERSYRKAREADIVVLMGDAIEMSREDLSREARQLAERIGPGPELIPVLNKIDRLPNGQREGISARTGQGLDALRRRFIDHVNALHTGGADVVVTNARHVEALSRAREALLAAKSGVEEGRSGELVASDLRRAQHHLGEITGRITPDDLLGSIFSRFCIGK